MKVLIVEDETAAAVNLQAILRKVAPTYEVLAVLESIEETVDYFRDTTQTAPDLVFMDIHLADGESFRIFDSDYKGRVDEMIEKAKQESQHVFLVHYKDKIIPLYIDRVAYFYTSNEKVSAFTHTGERYVVDRTLEMLQSQLPEDEFFRANRQFIISRKAVKDITVWFGSRLSLNLTVETPERIIISKTRVPEFKQWLTAVHPAD